MQLSWVLKKLSGAKGHAMYQGCCVTRFEGVLWGGTLDLGIETCFQLAKDLPWLRFDLIEFCWACWDCAESACCLFRSSII